VGFFVTPGTSDNSGNLHNLRTTRTTGKIEGTGPARSIDPAWETNRYPA
jgi:hypothetical protein